MTLRPPEHVPASMPTANRPANAGAAMDGDAARLDAVEKVTGRARYGRDRRAPGMLFAAFIRCPFGAATLVSIDEDAARAMSGVLEVSVTAREGRYHGQNVGHVVAESRLALRRGMRALAPKWKPGPVRTRIEDAMEPMPATEDEVAAVLADAPIVVEATYTTPVQTHSALETHGVMVEHDGARAVVYASTQGTTSVRDGIGEALGLPAAAFEVRCEYVGGGFGAKFGPGKEGMLAAEVAARHRRPVTVFVDRDEEHLDTGNRPSMRAAVRLAFAKDGTPLGGHVHTWGGVGVGGGGGAHVPSGRYRLGRVQKTHADVRFNAGAPRAMRAPGWPQGAFAEELALDEAAARAGIDPLELRTRIDASATRQKMYRLGAKLIGWDERRPNGSATGARRRGLGVGSTSWPEIPSRAEGEVAIHPDGSVEARTGTQDIGQGQRTVMGVVAARSLGVPLHLVNVRIGSSALPPGPGSGGSTTAPGTAPVMTAAALDAKAKLLELIAGAAGAAAGDLDVRDGAIVRGAETVMTWRDACARLPADGLVGRADSRDARPHRGAGTSDGVQFVDLEVDVEAGVIRVSRVVAIQACGRVVARKTAESQIIGGVIQGISFALFEERLLDPNVGAMVNANFDFYKILGTAEMPRIEPILWTEGQTGVRSLGEPPTVPTAGAVACAVLNAIGRPVRSLPLTPDRILAAMKEGAA
jgi:xanthine dehydrogenase YagR molybdenum-binding subunit